MFRDIIHSDIPLQLALHNKDTSKVPLARISTTSVIFVTRNCRQPILLMYLLWLCKIRYLNPSEEIVATKAGHGKQSCGKKRRESSLSCRTDLPEFLKYSFLLEYFLKNYLWFFGIVHFSYIAFLQLFHKRFQSSWEDTKLKHECFQSLFIFILS